MTAPVQFSDGGGGVWGRWLVPVLVREGTEPVLTVEQVEEIARRVMRESA